MSARPTRGTLHPTPLADSLLHRHRARSVAAALIHRIQSFRILCRAARALFALWRTGRSPSEHELAGRVCVVVFAANAERSPYHAVGRGSSSTELCTRRLRRSVFVSIASKPRAARPARASARGEPANRQWSTRTLAHFTWLSLQPTPSALHPTPCAEDLLHRHRARSVAAASKYRNLSFRIPCRAVLARFAPWRTSRPPTHHVRAGGLGVVVFAANAGRAPPHAVGRSLSSPTLRQVGGCSFETTYPKLPKPMPRNPRSLRPVENRQAAHGARARWRRWCGCLCSQRRARSITRRWTRLHFNAPSPGWVLRLRFFVTMASESVPGGPRTLRPVKKRSTAHGGQVLAELAWVSLHPTRSALHHTLLAEAPLQRTLSRSRATASIFRHNSFRIPCQAARAHLALSPVPGDARVLRPVENRPTAHGAHAHWRTWRGCLCSQRGASSIPRGWPRLQFNVPSPGRVLLLRVVVTIASEPRARRPARALPCGEPADRPRSTSSLAEFAWLSLQPTRSALHPTLLAEARLQRIYAMRRLKRSVFVSIASEPRAARPARALPRGEPANRQWSTRALAHFAWLSLQPTWGALHPAPCAKALHQ